MGESKASRILDAAETLLVSFGYRKVTVDDVVLRAGVGKGTVYLYWSSKRELFATVLTREAAALLTEHIAVLRADPAEARLHRLRRFSFLQIMRRPLAKALFTGDHEVLGELLTASKAGRRFVTDKVEMTRRHLGVLHEHGLLADDPAVDPTLPYRYTATAFGFFVLEGTTDTAKIDLEGRADALATTVRRAFEPAEEPAQESLRAAANRLVEMYERWLADLTASLPEEAARP